MKSFTLCAAFVLLLASGCNKEHPEFPVPTGPSSPGGPPPPPQPPPLPPPQPTPPSPGSPFSSVYSELAVGEVVHGAPASNDPECVEVPGFRCQHFRLTPDADG